MDLLCFFHRLPEKVEIWILLATMDEEFTIDSYFSNMFFWKEIMGRYFTLQSITFWIYMAQFAANILMLLLTGYLISYLVQNHSFLKK